MNQHSSEALVVPARRRLYPVLAQFPVVCFVGALLTDIAYLRTYDGTWETFSIWLLTAGLVMAGFAVVAGLIDFAVNPLVRAMRRSWTHRIAKVLVLLLSVINAFVHSRDGYTAVAPSGVTLSAIVVLLLIVAGWTGRAPAFRARAEVVA